MDEIVPQDTLFSTVKDILGLDDDADVYKQLYDDMHEKNDMAPPSIDADIEEDAGIEELGPYVRNWLDTRYFASIIPTDASSLDDVVAPLISYLYSNPRFLDETNEFQPFPAEETIKEIIFPNLACALLAGSTRLGQTKRNLLQVMKELSEEIDPAQASRYPLSAYPKPFNDIFGIHKTSGQSYEIQTRFPKLLATIIINYRRMPFYRAATQEDSMPTRNRKWASDISFLRCYMDELFPSSKICVDSCIMYYLLERLFRIDTKMRLFFAEEKIEKNRSAVSPAVLGDIFFSSPLVFISDEYIRKIVCSEEWLHIFIQLSAYWFPVIYHGVSYCVSHSKTLKGDLESFLHKPIVSLCGPKDTPSAKDVKDAKDTEDTKRAKDTTVLQTMLERVHSYELPRGMRMDAYNEKWCKFEPAHGYFSNDCYLRSIDEWKEMHLPEDCTDDEWFVIKRVQRLLR